MTIGTLAGAGTLGFLIPPSIVMIIYGVLSRTSVLKLFAAGIIPGIFLCVAFMGYVAIVTKLNPGMVGKAEPMSKPDLWRARFKQLPLLLPFLLLIAAVLGSMYGGLASPTEAAAFAVVATVVIMAFERSLTIANLKDAAIGTSRTVLHVGVDRRSGFLPLCSYGLSGDSHHDFTYRDTDGSCSICLDPAADRHLHDPWNLP